MSLYSNKNTKRSQPSITSSLLYHTLTALQLGAAGHVHGHCENIPRAASAQR